MTTPRKKSEAEYDFEDIQDALFTLDLLRERQERRRRRGEMAVKARDVWQDRQNRGLPTAIDIAAITQAVVKPLTTPALPDKDEDDGEA